MATETGTTADGLKWMYEEGTMAITGYEGTATVVNIPATINGKAVTLIHNSAFSYHGIEKINIPNSVKSIGESAFSGCSLTSVTIPNSVTSIGEGAFGGCSSLTSVSIPNSVTSIGPETFSYCRSLTSVSIPNSVTSIGWSAFSGCSSLTSVSIPDSVTSIEQSAFSSCSSLTSVAIPNSITVIDRYTFSDCSSLTSVSIPNSVKEIGIAAFFECSKMKSIKIPKTVSRIWPFAFGYYENALGQVKKVSEFSIYGYYGTDAEAYAKRNSFLFIGTQSSISEIANIYVDEGSYTYTGKEIKPTVKVEYQDDVIKESLGSLKEGTDYKVFYKNNINPGAATVTVTGINNYKGTKTVSFKIIEKRDASIKPPASVKAKAKKNKVKVSWKKNKKILSKIRWIEVQYATNKAFTKDVNTKKISKTKTKVTLKLKKKKTYYVRVRYFGKDGFSKWSKVKKVKTKK